MTPEETIAQAMPKWSNQTWLARRVIAALTAAGLTIR